MYGNFPGYRSKRGSVVNRVAYVYIEGVYGPARDRAMRMIIPFLRNTGRLSGDGEAVDVLMSPDTQSFERLMDVVVQRCSSEKPYVALFFSHGDGHGVKLDSLNAVSLFAWEAFTFDSRTGKITLIRVSEDFGDCIDDRLPSGLAGAMHPYSLEDQSPPSPPGWSGCF